MSRKEISTRIVLGLSWIIVLALASGCGGGAKTEAPPTIDPNLIYTQAAETVAAQLTAVATEAPPATPTLPPPPPTEAPQMTWPTPTTQSLALPGTLEAPIANPLPNTPIPIDAPTETAPAKADKLDTQKYMARLDYQDPPPGWRKPPGVKFDLVFTFTNLGDAEWNQKYTVRRYQGESFGSESKYTFDQVAYNTMTGGKTVKKNEQVTIRIGGLQAPNGQGNYVSHWRLCNNREDEGKTYQCFYLMEVVLVVQ